MEQEEIARVCVDCRHFKQHYVRTGRNQYRATDVGHCGNPRIRDKKPDAPACHRFSKK